MAPTQKSERDALIKAKAQTMAACVCVCVWYNNEDNKILHMLFSSPH